ncbi:MAG: hypothetical protein P8M30_16915 [Planctomycetaceae bacterium]|jgi:hypothetical protein|nr:hypothetical protein [Planctomycetaceae bacterium]MDG2390991.1 hypothetical protein [Planctomycetaceae bacterium]
MKTAGYILLALAIAISLIFYGVALYQVGTSPFDITGFDFTLSEGLNIDATGPDPYSGRMIQISTAPLLISFLLAISGMVLLVAGSIYHDRRAQ